MPIFLGFIMAYPTSILQFILSLIFISKSLGSLKIDECTSPTKLQVLFLVDGSLPQNTSNWPIIQTEITKEVARLAEKKHLPSVEYGLASYHTWNNDSK